MQSRVASYMASRHMGLYEHAEKIEKAALSVRISPKLLVDKTRPDGFIAFADYC